MPTGYTADIAEGKALTFEQFVWRCARAFGATVTMRDEPLDKLPPERFEADTYRRDAIRKAQTEIERLSALTPEQITAESAAEYERTLTSIREANAKSAALYLRYQALIDQVERWTPPTPEHEELKTFMLQQLTDSQQWDCDQIPEPAPSPNWLAERLTLLRGDIAYYEKEDGSDTKRTEGRNKWLAELRASVPMPESMP